MLKIKMLLCRLPIVIAFGGSICFAPPAEAEDDGLIVPGLRIGSITPDINENSLRRLYGKGRITTGELPIGEGFYCEGTKVLFENGENLIVTWEDRKKRSRISGVGVYGKRWRTKDGVRLGISLKEIAALNGQPFKLAGFEWDYYGWVTSWNNGVLRKLVPANAFPTVAVRFDSWDSTVEPGKISVKEYLQISGDASRSSSHPIMQKFNPKVGEIFLKFSKKNCEQLGG